MCLLFGFLHIMRACQQVLFPDRRRHLRYSGLQDLALMQAPLIHKLCERILLLLEVLLKSLDVLLELRRLHLLM